MRELSSLPAARPDSPAGAPSSWGNRQRLFFSGLTLLAFVSAALIYLVVTVPQPPKPDFEQMLRHVEELTPAESLDAWNTMRRGLDPRRLPGEAEFGDALFRHYLWTGVAVACAVIAVAVAAAGLFLKDRSPGHR